MVCNYHLHQVSVGLLLWASDHDGRYPPDLGTVAAAEKDAPPLEAFVCPASGGVLPKDWRTMNGKARAAWVNAHTDYVYVGAGKGITLGPDKPLLYDRDDDHGGTLMNVVFGDGHIELLTITEVHKRLGATAGTERKAERLKPGPETEPLAELTLDQAKALFAKMHISVLTVAVYNFERDVGRLPTAAEGLGALAAKPAGNAAGWNGPYIEAGVKDRWDHDYRYSLKGKTFEVISAGPDGKFGTADDVKGD
jgi:general secretion pathway protein G